MGKETVAPFILDTNVWVSGLLFRGTPAEFLYMIRSKGLKALIPKEALKELITVLGYPKLALHLKHPLPFILGTLVLPLVEVVSVAPPYPKQPTIGPMDNLLLASCEQHSCRYLVTGDKGMLNIKSWKNTAVISPAEYLNLLT